MMYLYIFEDDSLGQYDVDPNEDDKKAILDGILHIIFFEDGRFWEYDPDSEEGIEILFEKR